MVTETIEFLAVSLLVAGVADFNLVAVVVVLAVMAEIMHYSLSGQFLNNGFYPCEIWDSLTHDKCDYVTSLPQTNPTQKVSSIQSTTSNAVPLLPLYNLLLNPLKHLQNPMAMLEIA